MKFLLSILTIIFIQPGFSEDNEEMFCVVDYKNDETFLETIDKCKKGDVLAFGFSRGPVSKDTYNFTKKIAQACIIDTVQISDFRALCIYRGQLRKER